MKYFSILILMLFFGATATAVQCDQTCADDTDCDGNCKWCESGPDTCESCCDHPDQGTCDTYANCVYNGGECRNFAATACSSGIPEAPGSLPKSLWMILALFVSTLLPSWLIMKNKKPGMK